MSGILGDFSKPEPRRTDHGDDQLLVPRPRIEGLCSPTHGLSRRRRVSPRRTGSAQAPVSQLQCSAGTGFSCKAASRSIRTLPVANQFVVLHGHRQSCSQCGQTLREPIAFAQGKRRYTNSFAQYVVQLSASPLKAVARLLGVGWDLVKEILSIWGSASRSASCPNCAIWRSMSSLPTVGTST